MVYPGVVYASVHLDPGDGTCLSAGGTNCSTTITNEGVYNISLTLTNDVGPAQPVLNMFDCEWILHVHVHTQLICMLHYFVRLSNCTGGHTHFYSICSNCIESGWRGCLQCKGDTESFLS